MHTIMIHAGSVSMTATLNDSETSQKLWDALPIEAAANTWGDEIYFGIPVQAKTEPNARAEVPVGTLGYWEPGQAFCIFFGRTPVSVSDMPKAANPVNILGEVDGEPTDFRAVPDGTTVRLEQA